MLKIGHVKHYLPLFLYYGSRYQRGLVGHFRNEYYQGIDNRLLDLGRTSETEERVNRISHRDH